MHRAFTLIAMFVLTLGLPFVSRAQNQNPPAAVPAEELPPLLSVPKGYHYDAHGRRDPFVNPVPKTKGSAGGVQVKRPPGLKGVLVAEALIAGVVTSKEPTMNVVIISGPGIKTPYFARVGDALYDATVKSIKLDTVTFALNTPVAGDPKGPREIVRKVRPTPGEDQ